MSGVKQHFGEEYIEEMFKEMLDLVFPRAIIVRGGRMFTIEAMGLRHNDGSRIIFHVPVPDVSFVASMCPHGGKNCVRRALYKVLLDQRRIVEEFLGNLALGAIIEEK